MINAYNRFSTVLLSLLSLNLVAIASLTVSVDPYGVLGAPRIPQWNQIKPERNKHFRLAKAVEVSVVRPRTVILGSSTALRINPQNPSFQTQPAYNLAMAGASVYETKRYLEHALINQPDIKEVVLGLDFFSFGDAITTSQDFSESRLGKTHITTQDLITSIFSIDAIHTSLITLQKNWQPATKSGEQQADEFIADDNGRTSQNFKRVIKSYFQRRDRYKDYRLSPTHLENFRAIVELCKQHNIELKVFLSPVHAAQLEAIQAAGAWNAFETWKREIVKITPVWEFSDYNSITTEPMGNDMKNFVDGAHYQYRVADLIVDRLYKAEAAQVPPDFGYWLTLSNLDQALAKVREQQAIWQAQHPDDVKFIQDIKRQADRE